MLTRSIALTWTRRTWWDAFEGSRRTVTCFPSTAPVSEAQFVASVSSISAPRLTRETDGPAERRHEHPNALLVYGATHSAARS